MKRLLYFGADVDVQPIVSNPDIKEFVFIDQLPRDYLGHWGFEYYKGIYIPKYHTKGGMLNLLIKNMKKHFTNVKEKLDGDKLVITFDKNRKLTYWLNTLLPEFNEKQQFQKIEKTNDFKKKLQFIAFTNLTKEIVDDMLKCNILYMMGYHPDFPILEMLKLDKIISYSYVLGYWKTKNKFLSGKKYGEIDLRKKFLGYTPPKEIEIINQYDKNYWSK